MRGYLFKNKLIEWFIQNFEMPTSSGEERRILLVDRQQRAFIASNAHGHFGSPSPQYNSQYLPPSDGQGNLPVKNLTCI